MDAGEYNLFTYVLVNGQPVPDEKISDKTRNLLNDIGLDVIDELQNVTCSVHPYNRKFITITSDDEKIYVSVMSCCAEFTLAIRIHFANYPYRVFGAHF